MTKKYPKYKNSGEEWVGQIPEDWTMKRFKYWVDCINEKDEGKNGYDLKIALENIEKGTGKLIPSEAPFAGIGNVFQKGDVLFNKLRPYLAKAIVAPKPGICVSELLVFRPRQASSDFVLYRVLSKDFIDVVDGSTYGAKMPRANWSFIGDLAMPLPPYFEQKIITSYLDQKTTQIDLLLKKKTEQLDLLQEYRQAVINEAVTRGLNPEAPMRDSGVEWLGEVPAHWEFCSLKRKCIIVDCKHITPTYAEEGIPIVSPGELKPFKINLDGSRRITEEQFEELTEGDRKPLKGDIIYSRNASIGSAAYVDGNITFCMGQDVCLIRSKSINPRYLEFVLNSEFVLSQLNQIVVGSTFKRVNISQIKQFKLLVPPIEEQIQIIDHLTDSTLKIDAIEAKLDDQIKKLQSYRQSLISEVVTGKIDVREAVIKE